MDQKVALTILAVLFLNGMPYSLLAGEAAGRMDSVPSKLLYVVEGNQNYMIPYIERKLKNLRRPNSDILLYDSVASLNTLTQTTSIETRMIDLLSEMYASSYVAESKSRTDSLYKYSKFLKTFQSVLAIKVTPFENLIEYQFTLYDTVNGGKGIRYRNSSSIFIDPKSPHYQTDIIRSLNQVFDKANRRPEYNLSPNIARVDNTYFLTSADTLVLEPIVDDESAEDDRIYFWTENPNDSIKARLEMSKKNQFLRNLRPGDYYLYFRVSNGITYSRTDTLHLVVYVKPSIRVDRPGDETFFRNFPDRLVIQEYLFSNRHIDFLSSYLVKFNYADFAGQRPDLWVKICDKKGVVYVLKSVSPTMEIVQFDRSINPIIADINNMDIPIRSVGSNKYYISFIAKSPKLESKEVKDDLGVYLRRPVSFVYDAMMSPIVKNQLYGSWFNFSAGLNLHLNNVFSVTALFGTNLAQTSFTHYYTNFIANLHLFGNFEGGPAILVNHDRSTVALGLKVSYIVFSGSSTNLKIGTSYYNQGNTDLVAIHFTGNIFMHH